MTLDLALAHTSKQQPFNGLFYGTAATIIPVLFLAIAVQGPIFARVIRAYQTFAHPAPGEKRPLEHAVPVVLLATNAVRTLMVTVLAAAACGELLALISLYLQSDFGGTGLLVLVSAALLTVAAGVQPAGAFVGILLRSRRMETEEEQGDDQNGHDQPSGLARARAAKAEDDASSGPAGGQASVPDRNPDAS